MNHLPIIIGLAGPAGSGKDTVADLLVAHHGYTKLAFADALRAEVCAAFRVPLSTLTERETKEHPLSALALKHCADDAFIDRMVYVLRQTTGKYTTMDDLSTPRSPRQIMQWWGTDYRRAQNEAYWRDRMEDALYLLWHRSEQETPVAITDVRFPDEANILREITTDTQIWQITRPGYEVAPGAHASETTGADFAPDCVIDNGAGLTELEAQVLAAVGRKVAA